VTVFEAKYVCLGYHIADTRSVKYVYTIKTVLSDTYLIPTSLPP
jgi:hypothetical protein